MADTWERAQQRADDLGVENERLRDALLAAADSCERDRREPDKVLCHVLTMRRDANAR